MKPTVLVVDDEKTLCDAIALDLEFSGINVLKANNGNEAWEIFNSNPSIDLVVTDVRMSHGDGIGLLDKIRSHDKKTPIVIFITAFKDITDQEAYARGVNGILNKPFQTEQLLNEIKKFLEPNFKK